MHYLYSLSRSIKCSKRKKHQFKIYSRLLARYVRCIASDGFIFIWFAANIQKGLPRVSRLGDAMPLKTVINCLVLSLSQRF